MGVTGLWQIVQPCARPIKIETLNRKRLAVDASIWIYQFLKAVRDKEGNALRNSHVVGFFRRICKLLFFGIKPVFVFDGGAPALKRQTIRGRKARREGRREDAVATAGKILAKQMQRRAEEEEAQRRAEQNRGTGTAQTEEEPLPDDGSLVYVDELQMTQQERQQNRKFRKKDAYHLPELDIPMSEMGGPNDPRVMSLEDLQAYARQFEAGEDINVYDFSKIDYDSPFFMSLPASDRYNILNAARLRSRLRMGFSKEQLDTMFPDRMAFSKFQIERVAERNELTQRLMNLEGYQDFGGGRVAGEKSREYVLIKNDGVEGGWALGVIGDDGKEENPIDIDRPEPVKKDDDDWEEDDDFEDIPIEGLNRLPKSKSKNEHVVDELNKQRRAMYRSHGETARRKPKLKRKVAQDPNSLFIQDSSEEEVEEAEEWEEVDPNRELFGEDEHGEDEHGEDEHGESGDEDLQKAIALSMQNDTNDVEDDGSDNDMLDVFKQSAMEEAAPVPKGSGRSIANIVNKRAYKAAPDSREITSFGVPTLKPDDSSDEDTMDFQAALAESRKTKRKTSPLRRQTRQPEQSASEIAKKAGFSGPLPFEKLDLGSSLLGKKKMQERTEAAAGGFENPELADKTQQKPAGPMPPWFSGDLEEDIQAQKAMELEDRRKAREHQKQFQFEDRNAATIRRSDTGEIIDLEADEPSQRGFKSGAVIDLEELETEKRPTSDQVVMNDLAEEARAAPPVVEDTELFQRAPAPENVAAAISETTQKGLFNQESSNEEMIEWSESDQEDSGKGASPAAQTLRAENDNVDSAGKVKSASPLNDAPGQRSRSPSVEFEDVDMVEQPGREHEEQHTSKSTSNDSYVNSLAISPSADVILQPASPENDDDDDEFDDFSDPEEAELLRNLTIEAEEHARFASALHNKPQAKSQAENIAEYERELKQLRNQQKKDRRDADEVTQTMIQECQALLRLFGLPYVTAPMEAEAQCAELVRLGLVDGIVTDDSDCFLFGGTRIYKNMFNQAKFVECYLTSDLEKEFDLTRDKLISIAQLLGSDYTEGIPGVGPVTALEIISEFTTLSQFKEWVSSVQSLTLPKSADSDHPFRKKFRKTAATKLFLPTAFPDPRVELAYLEPEVDADPQAFQWGVPDLGALRSFLMATIGWTEERTDEILVPVIRDMNRRLDEGTQTNLTSFFGGSVGVGGNGEAFAARRRAQGSKRLGSALGKMAVRAKRSRGEGDVDGEGSETTVSTSKGKGKAAPKKRKAKDVEIQQHTTASEEDESEVEDGRKKRTKRRTTAAGKANTTGLMGNQEDDE